MQASELVLAQEKCLLPVSFHPLLASAEFKISRTSSFSPRSLSRCPDLCQEQQLFVFQEVLQGHMQASELVLAQEKCPSPVSFHPLLASVEFKISRTSSFSPRLLSRCRDLCQEQRLFAFKDQPRL